MNWAVFETSTDDGRWRQLLREHPHLLFHEPIWAEVMAEGLGATPTCLLVEKDGVVCGGTIGFTYRALWARLTYFNLPYGGMIGRIPEPSEFAGLLRGWARRSGSARVRIAASPEIPDTLASGGAGEGVEGAFRVIPTATHVLRFDGRDYDAIWMAYRSSVRGRVRKARKSGVSIENVTDASGIEVFYELYLESMERNHTIPKYPRAFVEAVVHRLAIGSDRGALLLAVRDGRPLAGILLADSAAGTHYLMGGSTTQGLQYCPNNLLMNHAIQQAEAKGYRYFDFLPSGDDPALEQFKAKWGAARIDVPIYELVARPLSMRAFDLAFNAAQTRVGRALVHGRRRRGGARSR